MIRRIAFSALLLCACSKPTPVEATLVDVTPGHEPVMKIHLKGKPSSYLVCSAGELKCDSLTLPSSGNADITIKIEGGKKVPDAIKFFAYSSSSQSGKPAESELDWKKTPKLLDTSGGGYGTTVGIGRKCDAIISWGPVEKLSMTVEPGASVEAGGITTTADGGGNISIPVKAYGAKPFADLPIEQTFVGDPEADRGTYTLNVTFADKTKLSATLHLKASMAQYHVDEFFKGIEKGPLLLPGEAGTKPAPGVHAAYSLASKKVVGKQVHAFREIEYVIKSADAGSRSSTCKYQSGATAALTMFDTEVRIIERRTGHVAFTRKFVASEHCDETVDHNAGTAMPPQSTSASSAEMDAWVSKQLGH
jgi:hypothetical protein